MKTKKILVTGANGYIGQHVVSRLLKEPQWEVLAVDIVNQNIDERATFISADIFGDQTNLYQRLGSPEVCIHLAWRDGFNHKSEYHIQAIPQHYQFIKSLIEGGLKQIAIMGSMHEIGYHEGTISEKTPCNPISFYGIGKNTLRQATAILTSEKHVVWQWLRGYYILGDDLKNHSVFTKISQAASRGDLEFPFTSGKNLYDFQTIEELAGQIADSVSQSAVSGIIECCSGHGVSLKEKVEDYIKRNQYSIKLKYGAFPDRQYDSPGIWGDTTKIRLIQQQKN